MASGAWSCAPSSIDASRVLVEVQDSGSRSPRTSSSRFFDPFITSKPEGLGMGLSICRSIIERHGGKVWAANNPDRGATSRSRCRSPASESDRAAFVGARWAFAGEAPTMNGKGVVLTFDDHAPSPVRWSRSSARRALTRRPSTAVVVSKMLLHQPLLLDGHRRARLVPDPARGEGFLFANVSRSRSDGLGGFRGLNDPRQSAQRGRTGDAGCARDRQGADANA